MSFKKYIPLLLLLAASPARAGGLALSKNADLLVPGRGSDLMFPPRKKAEPLPSGAKVAIPVFADGKEVALAHMTADLRVDAADLAPWIAANMNSGAAADFRTLASAGTVTVGQTQAAGFSLSYDDAEAVLRLTPDPARLGSRDISLQDNGAPDQSGGMLAPARLSGFVNLRAGDTFVSQGPGEGRQAGRIDLDGAVNIKGWVVESRGDWQEGDTRPFSRGETRLVHDWPTHMVRATAGDLSYPVTGFQSYRPMLGVGIARDFELQPYRVTQPAGQDSFVVRAPSRAEIIVNGAKVRTLTLAPGTYNMSDFPVTDGSNDVRLILTDNAGQVETRDLSLVSDQALLKKGLHAYAYNIGVESRSVNREIRYDAGRPAATMFHSYGFTDALTAGVAAQADRNVAQGGLTAVFAAAPGTFGFDAFGSMLDGTGGGGAASLTFRRRTPETRRDVSALLRWQSPQFAALGQTAPAARFAGEAAMRYSQPILYDINMGLGAGYRFARGTDEDDWSAGLSLSRVVSSSVTVTLNGDARRADGMGVYLNVTWSPPTRRASYAATVDTLAGTRAAEWRYRSASALRSLQADAGVVRAQGGGTTATGGAAYRDYRFDASVRHDATTGFDGQAQGQRSQVLFGTALAFADGHVAVTRPVTGSFVLLAAHDSLKGRAVGINPESASAPEPAGFQAEIDGFGPGVLPDATPYMQRPVKIDTRALPAGYDVGRDAYTALPSYKSGTLVIVGSAANIYADGRVLMPDGAPVALRGGLLSSRNDKAFPPQEFFTNTEGRFRIGNLAPGTYDLSLYGHPGGTLSLTIPSTLSVGRFDAGVFTLQEKSE